MKLSLIRAAFILGLAVISASSAQATYEVLTYTGSNFASYQAPYTGSDFLTFSVDITKPLGDNLQSQWIPFFSYSLSDGVNVVSDCDVKCIMSSDEAALNVTTDDSGQIIGWFFFSFSTGQDYSCYNDTGSGFCIPQLGMLATQDRGCSTTSEFFPGACGSNIDLPGTWQVTKVPEPSTLLMFAIGLLALVFAGLRWKRKRLLALSKV